MNNPRCRSWAHEVEWIVIEFDTGWYEACKHCGMLRYDLDCLKPKEEPSNDEVNEYPD